MTDYYRIRRQFLALLIGAIVATPIAIIAAVLTPSDMPTLNIERAAHTEYGLFVFALFSALYLASIFSTALNWLFVVTTCFVAASLAYDAYKLRTWRNSKLLSLGAGFCSFLAVWYGLSPDTSKDEIIAAMLPFLSSLVALSSVLATLIALRKLGRSATNSPVL